jgi:hypothetical protein
MAKVQGKKASTTSKKAAGAKPVTRAKSAKPPAKKPAARAAAKAKPAGKKTAAKKAVKKAAVKKPAAKKAAAKKAAPKKATPKKVAAKKAAAGKAAKAAPKKPSKVVGKKAAAKPTKKPAGKAVAKSSAKTAAKTAAKPAVKTAAKPATKSAAKAEKPADAKVKSAAKSVAKVAAKTATTPAVARPAAPVADEKKRRRSRTRVTSNGPATAAWFSQGDKPRSSSFIPAPPRAEAPSLVAAPPASSDRVVGSHELTEFAVRTAPVRIDIESNGGRIYLEINPNDAKLRVGEGIEWDFRYLGGADVVIEEMIIEFAKPSPFTTTVFRSRRPGAARPHRQLSGPAQASATGKRLSYTVRAFNAFKTEMASATPEIVVA